MRILFTTLGSPSHGRAQLPLARALAAAGHEVLAATTPPIGSVFEHDDVRVTTPIDDVMPGADVMPELVEIAGRTDLDEKERNDLTLQVMSRSVAGGMARELLGSLLPVAQDFQPDLILRDGMDLASVLMGEKLGIPQLPTPSGTSNSLDPADLLPHLNVLREELGLPTHEDPLSVVPRGRIDYVPPELSFSKYLPASWSYRQTVNVDRGSVLPRWVAELPTDRPLVFAALGTALPMFQERQGSEEMPEMPFRMPDPNDSLRTIIEAVSRLDDCTAIVATMGIPVDTDGLPSHVHVAERLPQPLLLEAVDLFLTHGGFNSIREALRTATPVAVLPQFGDQHKNAQRIQELGLGRKVTESTPDAITGTCREVLADSAIAARARRARMSMLALPEIESAVADLEKLVG
ncbi:glycosyltransferase [Streptomyces uncialis]|uniref:glycosyltransferase n=1 Tax=Streptomyces uncialis TaxID=1048205 RepID=UPI00379191B6|nr:glycosyltransferase [Streptomyces uncialis]